MLLQRHPYIAEVNLGVWGAAVSQTSSRSFVSNMPWKWRGRRWTSWRRARREARAEELGLRLMAALKAAETGAVVSDATTQTLDTIRRDLLALRKRKFAGMVRGRFNRNQNTFRLLSGIGSANRRTAPPRSGPRFENAELSRVRKSFPSEPLSKLRFSLPRHISQNPLAFAGGFSR